MSSFRNGWNAPNNAPSFVPRGNYGGGFGGGGRGGYGSSGGRGGWDSPRENSGWNSGGRGGENGRWVDGKHIPGARNPRTEKELFGDAEDPSKQHTGINFEKYDDIPVEATGAGVPDPITEFTNPPLDPVLLENIAFAHYTTPTPVQKYSVPIVAANRDLMACAQVSNVAFLGPSKHQMLINPSASSRLAPEKLADFYSLFFLRHFLKVLVHRLLIRMACMGAVRPILPL